jgi:hypothetical protein
MDLIDKQILNVALTQYQEKLTKELHGYSKIDTKLYSEETKRLILRCDNLKNQLGE